MISFLSTLLRIFFSAFRSRRTILSEIALVRKRNENLLRRLGRKKGAYRFYDKLFVVVLNRAADIKSLILSMKNDDFLLIGRGQIEGGAADGISRPHAVQICGPFTVLRASAPS
jgi:hypothetical protein